MIKRIIEALKRNLTKEGMKSTFIGLLMIFIATYGLFSTRELKFEDEVLYLKIMYYCGGIGVLLLLVSDKFIVEVLEFIKRFFENKLNK